MKIRKIINYIFLICGFILYLFTILTSSFHVFNIYSFFENEKQKYVALFITIALEFSVLFISYVYYYNKNITKFKNANNILFVIIIILLIYLWFLNYIAMEKNFKEKIIVLEKYDISFIIPLISSFFLPFSSISLSISIIILLNRILYFTKSYYKDNQQK
jgi:hypothetical protein